MIINLSKIDFGGGANSGGGNVKPEEVFDVQPTTTDQTITPTEGSVFSGGTVRAVTSAIDVNIASNNIKEGVTILGVEGSLKEEKPEESFNVQPTTADQTITPTEGSAFSSGTVRAVTSAIDSNIQPENIKEGVSILGVEGTLSGGGGSDVFVVPDGMKFSNSTIAEIPSNFDFSNVTDMNNMFARCTNLTTIPQMDTSKATGMASMFYNCNNLISIPQLNTPNVTNMTSMFSHCNSLVTIPLLDTSKVTDINEFFYNCTKLTSIPQLNTSNVTNMKSMFYECGNLTTIPLLDTSKVINMDYMFHYCRKLTTIPQLNTSNVKSMNSTFAGCENLTTIPLLDISKVTEAGSMFSNCYNLTTVPQLNTSKATGMSYMFANCRSLTTVEGIDFSGLTKNLTRLFGSLTYMSYLTRFIVNGKINVSISDNNSIKALTAIDYDSVKSILAAADRTDNTNAKTLAFDRTIADQNGELAALVSSCTTKGWTISGLTLQ